MSRWFRFHDEALNDPKIQKLDGETFKAWVNMLCIASQNNGVLPSIEDLAFALRRSPNDVQTVVERLLNGGLIDRRNGGTNGVHYAPHGWDKRQYKSDTSSDRVKRYRDKKCNVTETPPETETETETDSSSLRSETITTSLCSVVGANVVETDFSRKAKSSPSRGSAPSDGEAILLEAGVGQQTLADWQVVRKAKKAGPITETVAKAIVRKAGEGGVTPDDAVRIATENGWQTYYPPKEQSPRAPPFRREPTGYAAVSLFLERKHQ